MKAISLKTELKDRILWVDGDSTVNADYVTDAVTEGRPIDGLFVEYLTDDIKQYNSLVSPNQEIRVKGEVESPNLEFALPEGYSTLDVDDFVSVRLAQELKRWKFTPDQKRQRIEVTKRELELYEKLGLFDVLRTLIFVINTLQDKSIVWGVGRGSCVASYVLYLIGVHDVDSVQYDLDIHEFLRT